MNRRSDPSRDAFRAEPAPSPRGEKRPVRRSISATWILWLVVLAAVAVLLVGWEVLERRLVPDPSTGWRHFLITLRALVITGTACTIVFLLMRWQQRRVARTACRLAELVQEYGIDSSSESDFENPHLQRPRDVFAPEPVACPRVEIPGERCWQRKILDRDSADRSSAASVLAECRACEVYRRSTPDEFTALGEEINQLMFLLRTEARRVERLRAQMVEREKMFSIAQLASGVAHEVGNPLASISSVVQLLRRRAGGKESQASLDLIDSHVQRITSTVHDLARLAKGGGEGRGAVDVGAALERTTRLLAFDQRARGVDFISRVDPGLPTILGVPGQIDQVFLHLTLNALDAMGEGGTLTVGARRDGDRIAVTIEDTGAGIPAEIRSRIFNPFFTTKEPGRGTGLGLAVSYAIVQEHGGGLRFESTEGKGTVFTVDLPILDRASTLSEPPSEP